MNAEMVEICLIAVLQSEPMLAAIETVKTQYWTPELAMAGLANFEFYRVPSDFLSLTAFLASCEALYDPNPDTLRWHSHWG